MAQAGFIIIQIRAPKPDVAQGTAGRVAESIGGSLPGDFKVSLLGIIQSGDEYIAIVMIATVGEDEENDVRDALGSILEQEGQDEEDITLHYLLSPEQAEQEVGLGAEIQEKIAQYYEEIQLQEEVQEDFDEASDGESDGVVPPLTPQPSAEDNKIHVDRTVLDSEEIEVTAQEEIIGSDVEMETEKGEKPSVNPAAAPAPAPSTGGKGGESAPAPSGGGD